MNFQTSSIDEVKKFWTRNLNGIKFLKSLPETAEEFWAASDFRYIYHYHLPPLFDRVAREKTRRQVAGDRLRYGG